MKAQQCRDEIQKIVDRACPKLMMGVVGDYTQLCIQRCEGYIGYHFCIDVMEWEKAKWPEHIVRIRLLETLTELRDMINKTIREIE